MHSRLYRYRAPVLWLLLPFMGGLIAGRLSPQPLPVLSLLVAALVAITVAVLARVHTAVWACALCAAVICGGGVYYELKRARMAEWESLPPREARLSLRVERVFAPKPDAKNIGGIGEITEAPPRFRKLVGQKLYFSLRRPHGPSLPQRGERYAVSGLLHPLPRSAPVATFDGFLVNRGLNFRLVRGALGPRLSAANTYQRFCQRTQLLFAAILTRGLEHRPELAGILRGMLLGQAVDLTDEQDAMFMQSGTMHLFSISGLHIAAIGLALHLLSTSLRLGRWAHFVFTISLLWLYVDITGTSPSAVRAFVMVALFEAARTFRQRVNPASTLALAAFVSLLIDPMQLFGASFQMSYGIVASLLLLGLPLAEFTEQKTAPFRDLPKVTWTRRHHVVSACHRLLVSSLGIGIATALVSSVATLLYFQLFTPGALVANLVLIPISTLALWAGFLSLVCGCLHLDAISLVFNNAAGLTLWLMEGGIRFFVTLPATFFAGTFTSPTVGFIGYGGLLGLVLFGYSQQWDRTRGSWWPPFVWTTGLLAFGVNWG